MPTGDPRTMTWKLQMSTVRLLANIAVRTAREKRKSFAWTVDLLYGNVGDIVSRDLCCDRILALMGDSKL